MAHPRAEDLAFPALMASAGIGALICLGYAARTPRSVQRVEPKAATEQAKQARRIRTALQRGRAASTPRPASTSRTPRRTTRPFVTYRPRRNRTCTRCSGTGYRDCPNSSCVNGRNVSPLADEHARCSTCNGRGEVTCSRCGGLTTMLMNGRGSGNEP